MRLRDEGGPLLQVLRVLLLLLLLQLQMRDCACGALSVADQTYTANG
jgi:hypothetical protein